MSRGVKLIISSNKQEFFRSLTIICLCKILDLGIAVQVDIHLLMFLKSSKRLDVFRMYLIKTFRLYKFLDVSGIDLYMFYRVLLRDRTGEFKRLIPSLVRYSCKLGDAGACRDFAKGNI